MVNRVTLLGNIGKDAEKVSENVTKFSLATTEYWKDNTTGERKSKTEWHRVVVLGKLAPVMADLCKSGKKAYVEGKMQTSEWTTKEGEKRYTTEVIVDFGGSIEVINTEKSEGTYTPPANSSNASSSSSSKTSGTKEKAPVREEPREQVLSSARDDDHAGHDFVDADKNDSPDDDIPF
jgi:single-strand DNA-binding protein